MEVRGERGNRQTRTVPVNRLDRRKARTRQALIDAAVGLIAQGRGERASIQEITEAADIGFGSFYNHFASKEELFQTASEEVLERWAQMIDGACSGVDDPAEVFATSLRISGRLAWTHPDIAGFITGAGLELLDAPRGLGARALRDIRAGQAAGRFTIPDAEIALSAVAGGLLGLLRLHEGHPERVAEHSVDELAEACLRLLGLARRPGPAHRPTPPAPPRTGKRVLSPSLPSPIGMMRSMFAAHQSHTRTEWQVLGRELRARCPWRGAGRLARAERPA